MEVIDQLVIPPSVNHIMLLKYILTIALLLFLPYLCMVMGASFLSVYFESRGRRSGNALYSRFAKDVIEKLTITKNAELALGIIPVLSITFSYAQLLYEAKTIVIGILALSAVIFITAFIFIYKYRSTFKVKSILTAARSLINPESLNNKQKAAEEINEFENSLVKLSRNSGKAGVLLLYTAAYLFIGSTVLAVDYYRWPEINNILALLFSWNAFSNFLYLIAASGTITGGAILFYFYQWQGGIKDMDEAYSKFVKKFAGSLAFISALVLPLLLFYNFIYLPQSALSGSVFVYMVLALIVILLVCNFLYWVIKNSDVKFAALVFVMIFLVFTFNIIKDQIAFGNAIREQTLFIISKAEELETEKKLKVTSAGGMTGEQLYNLKCVSCHKFDTRLVGPPHNAVIPKYGGDIKKLTAYLLNPPKIDPNYPPMPNPGLKPKEAAAVAEYLIKKVGGK